ncbi:MAG: hypothetical protein J6X05_08450 [Bacteroidales bacterium]|nr:hypothetical protein [Bacteroidales bacterium]
MKKFFYNAVMAVMVAAATLLNTASATAVNPIDTVKSDSASAAAIAPETEDLAESEATLPLEPWMMENIDLLNEENLNAEGWMTENVNLLNEETINVEGWMAENVNLLNEETVNVEAWMTEDVNLLNEETLKLESWMF